MRVIYKLVNDINKKCYIGKTEDVASRLRYHIKSLRAGTNKNKHLQNAYNKYGQGNFHIEIVEELNETDDIDEKEKYYIALYKTYDPKYGYNHTLGGDGGNSYVDCMTDEEKEAHWKKHIEIRSGENNVNYGKHLYHKGIVQKYITDDEVEEYERQGWIKGASDYVRKEESKRNAGENNPFYGKKHSKETLDKIQQTKIKNGYYDIKRTPVYKGNENKRVKKDELDEYLKDGWVIGLSPAAIEKMKETKKNNPTAHPWSVETRAKMLKHFYYEGTVYYGYPELIKYLKEHGYPEISKKSIDAIVYKEKSSKYPELIGKITVG